MKKLMMAAAIVCAAVAAQAANINWSVANYAWTTKAGGNPASGSVVYLINAAAQSSIVEAINDGTFSASTAGVIESKSTSNAKGYVADHAATSASLTAGTSYDFKFLVIDTTSVKGETWYNISSSINKAAYDPTSESYKEVQKVAFTSSNFSAGNWTQAVSTPEPTSAMLLLLGVAGLALRRKQKQA